MVMKMINVAVESVDGWLKIGPTVVAFCHCGSGHLMQFLYQVEENCPWAVTHDPKWTKLFCVDEKLPKAWQAIQAKPMVPSSPPWAKHPNSQWTSILDFFIKSF